MTGAARPRLLVTGASGMIGALVVARGLALGHPVTAFMLDDGAPQGYRDRIRGLLAFVGDEAGASVEHLEVRAGGFDEAALLAELVAAHPWVVHAAGVVQGDDAARHQQANVGLVRRLAAAEGWTAAHRLVAVTSVAAQGPGADARALREDDPPDPRGHYGRTKHAAEEALVAADLPARWVAARPCSVIGPGDENFRGQFDAARAGWFPVFCAPARWFQLVYGPDLARALLDLLAALDAGDPVPDRVHVGDPTVQGYASFAAALAAAAGRPALRQVVIPLPAALALAAVNRVIEWASGRPQLLCFDKMWDMNERYWVHSMQRFQRAVPGFEWTPLPEACARTMAWYQAQDGGRE